MKTMIAITGASGFLGKRLVQALVLDGHYDIRVLSRNKALDLEKATFPAEVEIIEGDMEWPETLEKLLAPNCTVINLAYLWKAGSAKNLAAIDNLLDVCRKVGVARLIHCSTADLVGRASVNKVTEETSCHPVSEYGVTKLNLERRVVEAASQKLFDAVIVRPTAVFGGGGEQLKKLICDLSTGNAWLNYAKSCLFGERRMNLVHIANVVQAIVFMIRYPDPLKGEVFIVSDDDEPNNNFAYVERFLMAALKIKDYPLPRMKLPASLLSALLAIRGRNNTNPLCNYDSSKLRGLGYQRAISLEDGLAEFSAWYRSAHEKVAG